MAHRNLLRGACRALTESQASLRSASSKHGSSGAVLRSVAQNMQGGQAFGGALSQCPLMMRSVRQGSLQVSAFPSTVPLGFAASALSVSGPLSVLGSVAQHRGVSSTDLSEEGEGDEADATYKRRSADSQTSLRRKNSGDDPPDHDSFPSRGSDSGRRIGVGPRREAAPMPKDTLAEAQEIVATAQMLYTRRAPATRSATSLPSLAPELRDAMYGAGGVWDRVLVDVRRSVRPLGRQEGKEELYTAMVASGNMKGLLGLGIGIAETAQLAVASAHLDSMGRLAAVPLYRGHTIYHAIRHDFHRMKMILEPRPEGWGLTCSDLLYELCNLVGVRNISIKMHGGSRANKFFVAQCFQEALLSQSAPHDGVEGSGMYIREVYYRRKLPAGLTRGVDVM